MPYVHISTPTDSSLHIYGNLKDTILAFAWNDAKFQNFYNYVEEREQKKVRKRKNKKTNIRNEKK